MGKDLWRGMVVLSLQFERISESQIVIKTPRVGYVEEDMGMDLAQIRAEHVLYVVEGPSDEGLS